MIRQKNTVVFPSVETNPVSWGIQNNIRFLCPDHQAIVNPETNYTYAITSKRYSLVRHEDLLKEVEQAILEAPEYGTYKKNIWLSPNGGRMKATYRFSEIEFPIDLAGDVVNPKIEVLNSYDLSWAKQIIFGAFRLICSNGLTIGKTFMHYNRKHYQSIEKERIHQLLMDSMERFSDQTDLWRTWVDKITTYQDYERVMGGIDLNQTERKEIEEEIEISSDITIDSLQTKTLTYWLFYNILCQFISHKIKSEYKRTVLEQQMRRLF